MVTFASILGSVLVNPLSKRFDTVKLYYYTNLVLAALSVMMWFLPTGPAWQTLWLAVILGNGVILGFTLPLHFSLMAFADDYGEWKTGVRSSGMNFAFNLFCIKLAWASSAVIISLVFIFVAYQPGAGNQTPPRYKASPQWRRCCPPCSTCCWRSLSAPASSTIP
jgi:Na+/melibiose symporter-like transporter